MLRIKKQKEGRKTITATQDASSLAEVLDRIFDKGIVADIWARISLVGIEIQTVEAQNHEELYPKLL
jgi:hypothetical protein